MSMKIGCDIVQITRVKALSPDAKQKIFHPSEMKNAKPDTLAGIIAAKESVRKIENSLGWLDIEVRKETTGKPTIKLHKQTNVQTIDISISHDGEYAIASAIAVLKD